MEYLDLFDSSGNPLGKTKPKAEVHRDGDWHKSVHVWIINSKGELLIQRRSPQKDSWPDMWDISAAGHVSAGEDSLTTAIREAQEEIGITFPKEQFEYLFTAKQDVTIQNGTYINRELNDVYLLEVDLDISTIALQPEEVAEVKFVPWKELKERVKARDSSIVPHEEEYTELFSAIEARGYQIS